MRVCSGEGLFAALPLLPPLLQLPPPPSGPSPLGSSGMRSTTGMPYARMLFSLALLLVMSRMDRTARCRRMCAAMPYSRKST